jgi:hypothetical protein
MEDDLETNGAQDHHKSENHAQREEWLETSKREEFGESLELSSNIPRPAK